ncbi:hypothetical protein FQA39_LY12504 [Lamprigera yunnana]|nr:hypothetical protein FQA39_LY12504 [Lamprigera yunnana]
MQIYSIVLLIGILACVTCEKKQADDVYWKRTNAFKVCSEKYNLNITKYNEYVKAMNAGGEKISVFSECYLSQLGFVDGNGTILYDAIKRAFGSGMYGKMYGGIVDYCKYKKGNNSAETSYKFMHCLSTTINHMHLQIAHSLRKQFAMNTCSNKTKISIRSQDDYVKELNAGGEQVKLFSECYLRQLGFLDSNGTILYDKIKNATYSTPKYSSIIDHCKNEMGNGTADTCYRFSKCFLNKSTAKPSTRFYSFKKFIATRVCSKKTNLNITKWEDYLKEATAGGEQIRLYSECYLKQLKCLDDNGTLSYEQVKQVFCTEKSGERCSLYVDQCKNENRGNSTEIAHQFLLCLIPQVYRTSDKKQLAFKLSVETKQQSQKEQA